MSSGGASTFVGGDGIGVSKDSKNANQAWNFLSWMMSEDAQVEVLAKDKDVVSRSDLANNKYASADPRLVTINEVAGKGETPVAINFQQAFNAPNSPWLTMVRNAVLGDGALRRQGQRRRSRRCWGSSVSRARVHRLRTRAREHPHPALATPTASAGRTRTDLETHR